MIIINDILCLIYKLFFIIGVLFFSNFRFFDKFISEIIFFNWKWFWIIRVESIFNFNFPYESINDV